MIPIEQLNIDTKKDNIIEGIMKCNGLYCLVAEPKVGISFLALQIASSLTNNKEFLGFKVNPTPVLYISTELSSLQLKERLNITSYEFSPNSFFFLEKDSNHRLCLTDDLQLELKEFSEAYNGKFVIVDIMCGIDYGSLVVKYLGHTKIDETLNTYSHMYQNRLDTIVNIIELQNGRLNNNNNNIETKPTILLEHKETLHEPEKSYDYEEYEIVKTKNEDDLVL